MKHLWFGAGLLAVLLAVSLWLGDSMQSIHEDPARDLEKAARAAMEEDWALATALYNRSAKSWQSRRNRTAILIHHDLIGQIDMGFAALENYARREETGSFAATCDQLAIQIRSIPQSHRFRWWNLL